MTGAAWVGLGLGGGLVAGLAALLNRVLRPAREARMYTDEAGASTEAIEEQLRPLAGLVETSRHAGRLADALAAQGGGGR